MISPLRRLAAAVSAVPGVLPSRRLARQRRPPCRLQDAADLPVPYALTPKGEAFLSEHVRPDQIDRLDLAAWQDTLARHRYPDCHPAVGAAAATLDQAIRDSTPAELSAWARQDRLATDEEMTP